MRLFFATDLHGADREFRKFLAAASFYEARILVLGGDLIGTRLALVRRRVTCGFEATGWDKRPVILATENEREAFVQASANAGDYAVAWEGSDPPGGEEWEALFTQAASERLRGWMELAHARLEDTGVELIVIPGNDDPTWVDPLLADRGPIINADRRVVVADRVQIAGLGLSTPTPWDTPRELPDERIAEELDRLLGEVDPALPLVLDVHVPPYGTGLDTCPVLDRDLRPVIGAGGVLTAPVGSRALRDVILRDRPALGLFGHVHEARGFTFLGTTLCANPGSEAGRGKLLGFLADVGRRGVQDWLLTEG